MEHQEVYLLLPPEAQRLLDDNGVDLVHELRRQGLDIQRGHGQDPAIEGEGQTRDVVLVILASAALVAAISAGVSRVLDAVGRNKRFVAEDVRLAPVVGPDGHPITTSDGSPVLYWHTSHSLLEPQARASTDRTELSAPGIRFTQESTTARPTPT